MTALLLHDTTQQALDRFIKSSVHALLLAAPVGAGKATVADFIASQLLDTPEPSLANHPYYKKISPPEGKAISIDDIRAIIHFTTLKTVGQSRRVVVIENSQHLTLQAQNALLKTIEEPPAGTLIILTAPSELSLLPTIRSRIQQVTLQTPPAESAIEYFQAQGHTEPAIRKALLISGGLPGLMQALLVTESGHPLLAATATARELLQKTAFERLVLADKLATDRQLWSNTLFILGQMADIAIREGNNNAAALRRWQTILSASHEAQAQTLRNAQAKLVLLNFMLAL